MNEEALNKPHTFRVVTRGDRDGTGKTEVRVAVSAMGPNGSGTRIAPVFEHERPLTVNEQAGATARQCAEQERKGAIMVELVKAEHEAVKARTEAEKALASEAKGRAVTK